MILLEESIGVNFGDLCFSNGFLDMTQKHEQLKKIDKLGFIKIENVCAPKDIMRRGGPAFSAGAAAIITGPS